MSSPLLDECNRFYKIGLIYEKYRTFKSKKHKKVGEYSHISELYVESAWGEIVQITHLSAGEVG